MRQLTLIVAFVSLCSWAAIAQTQSNKQAQERIEAYKIAFFTKKLQLTAAESKVFWPLYNEYEQQREQLRKQLKPDTRLELMSDDELKAHLYKQLDIEEQLVALRRAYFEQFMEVLPLRKVALIPQAEQQFKRQLLEELRRRRQQRQGVRDQSPHKSRFKRDR